MKAISLKLLKYIPERVVQPTVNPTTWFFSDQELRVYLAALSVDSFMDDVKPRTIMELMLNGMPGYRSATRAELLEEMEDSDPGSEDDIREVIKEWKGFLKSASYKGK